MFTPEMMESVKTLKESGSELFRGRIFSRFFPLFAIVNTLLLR